MPLSYVLTSGNGVTTNFAIPFQYLDKSHMHAYVSGVEKSFTWLNAATITISPAPPSGTLNVEIRRVTDRSQVATDFVNGSVLKDTDLDAVALQALFIAQEYFEQAESAFPTGHTLDSHSDATPGESVAKGALRVYDAVSKTRAVVASDGGVFQGDSAQTTGTKFLPVGTDGQCLEVDTAVTGRLKWAQGLRALLSAAGDLLVGSAAGVAAKLAAPLSTNLVLVADTAQALKMKWSATLAGLTLTAPTINNGTQNSPTINTPAIVTPAISSGGTLNGSFTGTYTLAGTPTISSPSISSPTITGNTVGTGALKTASGSAGGTLNASNTVNITMNDYAFFPYTWYTGTAPLIAQTMSLTFASDGGGGTTVGRFTVYNGNANNHTYGARWRYVTASDNPVVWVIADPVTGELIHVWASDDPTPGDVPGLIVPGLQSLKLTAKDFESFSVLNAKAAEAADVIRESKRRMEHQAYRAMQLVSGQDAPAQWILENVKMDLSRGKITEKPSKGRL